MSSTYQSLEMDFIRQAERIGTLKYTSPADSVNHMAAELGRIAAGTIWNDNTDIKNAVGRLAAYLIIYCDQRNLTLTQCMEDALEQTKQRTAGPNK